MRESRFRSSLIPLSALALAATLSACSSNLSRFDVINSQPQGGNQITRAETGDQGSGAVASVVGPGGHTLTRSTVGGYYLRRNDVNAAPTGGHPQGTRLSAGLYGNPRASR